MPVADARATTKLDLPAPGLPSSIIGFDDAKARATRKMFRRAVGALKENATSDGCRDPRAMRNGPTQSPVGAGVTSMESALQYEDMSVVDLSARSPPFLKISCS